MLKISIGLDVPALLRRWLPVAVVEVLDEFTCARRRASARALQNVPACWLHGTAVLNSDCVPMFWLSSTLDQRSVGQAVHMSRGCSC